MSHQKQNQMTKILSCSYNLFQVNTYTLFKEGGSKCVVIDPGFSTAEEKQHFYSILQREGLNVEAVLLTHTHFDHIFGVKDLQEDFGASVLMHAAEEQQLAYCEQMGSRYGLDAPDTKWTFSTIEDGQEIEIAGLKIKVITTPGHSPGSVSFYLADDDILISGDTLFAGSIGRSDLPGGEYDDEIRSIMEKLILLPPQTEVFPGHGPSTTIDNERTGNPFLEPFNEKEELEPLNREELEPIVISSNTAS